MAVIFTANLQDNAPSTTIVAAPANGTLIGAGNTSASSIPGPGGNLPLALSLDGVDDYASFATVAAAGTNATYVLLAKIPTTQGAFSQLLSARGASPDICGLHIGDTGGNELGYTWRATPTSFGWNSGVIIPTNEWCLLAVSVNSTTAVVYCITTSGVDSATHSFTHASTNFAQVPKIGADGLADRFTEMHVAGAAIYNETLSQAALQAIWDAAQPDVALADTEVAPFDVFTTPVTDATDVGALTLSAGASGYDWSGIAWKSVRSGAPLANCSTACTLISLNHGVSATHCGPIVGDLLHFRSPDGTLREHIVIAITFLGGDVRLVRFGASPHASLARYPIVSLGTQIRATDLNWWCPQHNGDVAKSRCREFQSLRIFHIPPEDDWGVADEASGRPSLLPLSNGSFAILGTAWHVGDHANVGLEFAAIQSALNALGEAAEEFEIPFNPSRVVTTAPLPLSLPGNEYGTQP